MKKRISILLMLIMCVCAIVGCGDNASDAAAKANNYDADFDSILNDIDKLYEDSNYVAAVVYTEWDEHGPEHVAFYLEGVYKLGSGQSINYDDTIKGDLGYDYMSICETYVSDYNEIVSLDSSILTKIQTFKSNYATDHQAAVDALTSYYAEASAYGQFVINPSGNLLNFSRSVTEYKSNCDSLTRSAQLAK